MLEDRTNDAHLSLSLGVEVRRMEAINLPIALKEIGLGSQKCAWGYLDGSTSSRDLEGPTATCLGANHEALVIDSVGGAEAAR